MALVLLMWLFVATSCHRNDALVGRWTVDRVNVEFDENKSTPEMVRQYGELEKDNVIEISCDSTLTFISSGDTLRGRCSLHVPNLYCDGILFGQFDNGLLKTETSTPMGELVVYYKKASH